MQGAWIRKPKNGFSVVFVHGILSSGEACWRHDNGAYWPRLLESEPGLGELGIYVYSYETGIFSGTYSLNDVVDDFKERFLTLDKVAHGQSIVFVCHSMGGIVVRKFLVERVNDLLDRNLDIGLFLVASPSLGSAYANWLTPLAKFLGHSQADALRFSQSNTWLNGLDKEFQNLKESGRLKLLGKELIEDKFVVLPGFLRKQIVEPFAGARYFGEPFKVPGSDHFSIAKPKDAWADQHRLLLTFIEKMTGTAPAAITRSAALDPAHPIAYKGPIRASGTPVREAVIRAEPPGAMKRVFLSYRHVKPDEDLALALEQALADDGCQVFIDRGMLPGTEWATEIDRELRAARFFVVLLSAESIRSDMVRQEVKLAHELKQQGSLRILPIRVDLTGIGGYAGSITADQWYYGLAHRMLRELSIPLSLAEWWQDQTLLPPLNRLMNFFEDGVLGQLEGSIAVFVDEIDTTIKLPFSDDFFAAIRACFNARANNARFNRLCFVLLGVASPADLIRDAARTPFNIGKRIDLSDFNDREARLFLRGLSDQGENAEPLLTRILHWTHGHPFLTQRLCALVRRESSPDEAPETRVDRVVAAEFLGVGRRTRDDNLKVINDRIAQAGAARPALLKVYAKVHKGKPVQDQPPSPVHSALKLSGLVKTDERGHLVVRNRIYQRVFDRRWIAQLRPARWKQRSVLGVLLASVPVFGWWIGAQQLTVRSGGFIVLAWLGIAYPEPDMVDIKAGSFLMGSPDNEEGRFPDEGPQHRVDIAQPFRLGKYEVTFDEYDVFAFLVNREGGCSDGHQVTRPPDEGWGRGRRPVINVTWTDATCYAEWLSRKTGKKYRLPSEAEWEYAARAGTEISRPWDGGLEAACGFANVYDQGSVEEINKRYTFINWESFPCSDGYAFTAPVGTYRENSFELNNMLGNVWEWTCSAYTESYDGSESRCVDEKDGGRRVIRGGGWFNRTVYLRSATRSRSFPGYRNNAQGFRLAQDL